MGSGVIYYEYEKREKFEDYDMKADAELGTFKIRRYHFDNESFVHPLHSVPFDPDHPYEIPIEALMADKILSSSKYEKSSTERPRSFRRPSPHYSPRTMLVAQRERSTSSVKGTRSFRRGTTSSSVRKPKSWELIPPSEGWMCDSDDKKEIGGMDPSENEGSSEEDPEMEEEVPEEAGNPEDRVPATPSLPMDIDAEEDFQRYIEELGRAPEPSPPRSSQASVPDEPGEAADRQSVSRDGSSHNLSEVWQSQSSSPILSPSLGDLCMGDQAGRIHYSLVSRVCKDNGDVELPDYLGRKFLHQPERVFWFIDNTENAFRIQFKKHDSRIWLGRYDISVVMRCCKPE
ncbi:hypothetical protein PIB30_039877 [Stylosanthes scabra]|uniref:Uncharacterized protein n=1 Tax=Stylosanthes scabra TaxID=79078 RepID=A0ABU6WEH3_9FABA|nr:hypothetical protein [Stylosanthes scabra]